MQWIEHDSVWDMLHNSMIYCYSSSCSAAGSYGTRRTCIGRKRKDSSGEESFRFYVEEKKLLLIHHKILIPNNDDIGNVFDISRFPAAPSEHDTENWIPFISVKCPPKKVRQNATQKLCKQLKGYVVCELQAADPLALP